MDTFKLKLANQHLTAFHFQFWMDNKMQATNQDLQQK